MTATAPHTDSIDWAKGACRDPKIAPLFHDTALDYDPSSEDFAAWTVDKHQSAEATKRAAEQAAVDACYDCPIMQQCAAWSLRTDVPGVAGGYTETERHDLRTNLGIGFTDTQGDEAARTVTLTRGKRGQIDDSEVRRLTEAGRDVAFIAQRLSCSERTVSRARDRLRKAAAAGELPANDAAAACAHDAASGQVAHSFPRTRAAEHADTKFGDPDVYPADLPPCKTRSLNRHRLETSMQAIYDVLADGYWHHVDELVQVGSLFVPEAEAVHTWTVRNSVSDPATGQKVLRPTRAGVPYSERVSHGARDKLTNALSASQRIRGVTFRGGPDGTDLNLYRLHPDIRAAWLASMQTDSRPQPAFA